MFAAAMSLATACFAPSALGQSAPDAPATRQAIGVPLTLSNFDAGGGLAWRFRFAGGAQLGLDGRALSVRSAYLDGYAAQRGDAFTGAGQVLLPLVQMGPLEIHLRASLGAKALRVDESAGPHRRSTTLLGDVGPIVNVRLAPGLGLRTGWLAITHFQLTPGFDVEALGQVLLAGAVVPLSDDVQLHADVETGGTFGFDGDGGKYLVRGTVGARWVLGGAARSWLSF